MFFRRAERGKPVSEGLDGTVKSEGDGSVPPSTEPAAVVRVPAPRHEPIGAPLLRRRARAKELGFASTAELEPSAGLIGQDRALKAIELGAGIRARDFNVFVLGLPASGKSTAVKLYLGKVAARAPMPPDWVYVNNFEDPGKPRALKLLPGHARRLARGMTGAIDELSATLPAAFESEDYQARRRAIDEEFRSAQEKAFETLNRKAAEQNIAVLRTPNGFAMAPMHDGNVVKPEVFNQLPEAMQREVAARIEALQKDLETILSQMPRSEKARRQRIAEANEVLAKSAVEAAFDDLRVEWASQPDVLAYFDAAAMDLVSNVELFLSAAAEEGSPVRRVVSAARDLRFRRYMVNVMVTREGEEGGAPVYEELNPSFGNLMGRAEHIAEMGALVTDFLLIKPGALHRANGGYLLADARKLLMYPFAWEALKRTLKAGQIRIEQPEETAGLIPTQTLEPEPIPLEIKVILFGERELYYLLSAHDPEFSRLFKVQADFDDTIERTGENELEFARLIASVIKEHQLRAADADAVARIIDEASRYAEHRDKLSIEAGRIADMVREADHWAGVAGHSSILRGDVERAILEHIERADRLRDRAQETIARGVVLVDTAGAEVGQINGLSVLQLGDFAFGRPSRITARVRMGQGRVMDIEREAKLGGPLHSKGVMILWGYLAGRFAESVPLALAATLVFEQSYGGVDGDSASAAELFAILSALSDLPLRQDIAVTGSVNQKGEVQAIGGVNEKIEGFFDVCKARGLTGTQGVIIPAANMQHLMLAEEVVKAAEAGQFKIHAISTIDEGIALLTGVLAGERGADGRFSEGTVYRLVEDKLESFARRARAFAVQKTDGSRSNGGASS